MTILHPNKDVHHNKTYIPDQYNYRNSVNNILQIQVQVIKLFYQIIPIHMNRLSLLVNKFPISNQQSFSTTKEVPRDYVPPIKTKFQIIGKDQVNHNCYIFKFKFAGPKFTLKNGQHFRITQFFPTPKHPEGEQISKYYTPITTTQQFQNDKIQALIKVYKPLQKTNYLGGRLGNHLNGIKIGDTINVEGPFGKLVYEAPGRVSVCPEYTSTTKKVSDVKRIFFIAAGTGLTPIYQTLLSIVSNPQDKTEIILLFCNRQQHDIFLRERLEAMQPRIKLVHMLDDPSSSWKGLTGRVNPQVLNSVFPLTDPDTYYISCGPSAFSAAMKKIFEKYPQSKYFKI